MDKSSFDIMQSLKSHNVASIGARLGHYVCSNIIAGAAALGDMPIMRAGHSIR